MEFTFGRIEISYSIGNIILILIVGNLYYVGILVVSLSNINQYYLPAKAYSYDDDSSRWVDR